MAKATSLHVHLTPVREKLLCSIDEWRRKHGYQPTVRELQGIMGLASVSTVHVHLTILRDEGVVDWVDGQVRTLHLTPLGDDWLRERAIVMP